ETEPETLPAEDSLKIETQEESRDLQKPAESTPTPQTRPSLPRSYRARRIRMAMVLCAVLIALVSYGAYWVVWLEDVVYTDDAYAEARIVSVSSRLPGRVASVPINEGDTIKKGQILVQLTRNQMRIRMNQIKAEVAGAAAKVSELTAGPREEEIRIANVEIRIREVELERRRDLLKRMEALARFNAISAQDLEQQRAEVELGKVELLLGGEKLKLLMAGSKPQEIERAQAELALAKAKLSDVRADLNDLTIRSPIDGVVARRMVDPGEFVEDGQGLMQVVETGKTWVVANLEEGDFERVHVGQPVDIEVDAYPGALLGKQPTWKGVVGPKYSATLSRFSILSTTSTSGSFIKVTQRVPVRIDWVDNNHPPMYPGLNVEVWIHVKE
ncbi:MAG: HlyD family secretion protein, partial [SAR324 cluster bacterium]|nr:HlyD family secretion protein [SAR324 cluster bacterium]